MRLRSLALFIPLLCLAAASAPVRTIRVGQSFTWSVGLYPHATRFLIGRLQLLAQPVWEDRDDVGVRLVLSAPGRRPIAIDGERALDVPARIWVGRWNRAGEPYVLLQSYTGGAHCCDHLQLAVPERGRFRIVDLGSDYDSPAISRQPRDLDGDGRIDFVVEDDENFQYVFAGHGDGYAPPRIYNVLNGRVVDVSARPSFAPVFRRDMAVVRKACVTPDSGRERNGACAAYVADAARLGQFNRAWRVILRVYDRTSDPDFPAHLRDWLESLGYIKQ